MKFDIIRGKISQPVPTESLVNTITKYFEENEDDTGSLYLGYPLSANADYKVTIDALLISKKCGAIIFVFPKDIGNNELIKEEQDTMYYNLDFYFKKYISLKKGRNLSFSPKVISVVPTIISDINDPNYIVVSDKEIPDILNDEIELDDDTYQKICEALQKVASIKPKKKRQNVKDSKSFGGKIKRIEKEIANLDQWQKKAAMELPEAPQRIRGLAGSGKTIVLALKAAYMHSQYPDWNIAITFYTRSLSQQLKRLIQKFYYEYSGDDPDWEKIHIVHAWGTNFEEGIYSIAARSLNMTPLNYESAKMKYGRNDAFKGICNELIPCFDKSYIPKFDAVLIDEAQDMPSSFFRIVYNLTNDPKRITWAYDELQNLSEMVMPSLDEMFGKNEQGISNVILENKKGKAMQDIILPICYRNPPWSLSVAHALGFGLYRKPRDGESLGIVQMFDEPNIWEEIGYECAQGNLNYGEVVTLKRKEETTPEYFGELLSADESMQSRKFNTVDEQYAYVAREIKKNIENDELDLDDILVIFPNPIRAKNEYIAFRKFLLSREIESILVGIDTDRDTFRMSGFVSCSSIYRAKGNEAPMVYVLNTDWCAEGYELIKLRNILFAAITRSRAWVRIYGVGEGMDLINDEIDKCKENSYSLKFKLPTTSQLTSLRRINRERTNDEVRQINLAQANVKKLIEGLKSGELDSELIPELESLMTLYKKKKMSEQDDGI